MIKLDLGPEGNGPKKPLKASRHLVNLKTLDSAKHEAAHARVTLDLKEEIRAQTHTPEKIQIVGHTRRKGLGKLPMLAAALLVILVLNVGQIVFLGKQRGKEALALASEGFTTLQDAGETLLSGEDGAEASLFTQAETLFEEAKTRGSFLLNTPTPWLEEPTPVQSLRNMIQAGKLMSQVGTHISEAKKEWEAYQNNGQTQSLTAFLKQLSQDHIEPAAADLKTIDQLLADVDLTGTGYEEKLASAQEKLKALSTLLGLWVDSKDAVWSALGDRYPQTYLVLLENNDELRQGGGFIGNFALLTLNDGLLESLEFHDIYEFDGLFHEPIPVPAHELENLTDVWRMRDSNISADFPISAEKAAWFLEQEGGPGVDGVIGLNLSAVEELIKVLGPVEIPSFKAPLSGEDLGPVLSAFIESKTLPKSVLSELSTAVQDKLKDRQKMSLAGLKLWEQITAKQVSFYQKDPLVESTFHALGMDGALPDLNTVEGDFLLTTFTNRGGNKTDRYISSQLTHDTAIDDKGQLIDTLTLTRTHTFGADQLTALKDRLRAYGFTAWTPTLEGILGMAPNFTGIRFYLPEGAHLIETTGIYRDEVQFYYDPFLDHSYFYVDQILKPGETQSFKLSFKMPTSLNSSIQNLNFQNFAQPGLKLDFTKTLTAPQNTLYSSDPAPTQTVPDKDYFYEAPQSGDQTWAFLVK